MFNIMFTKRTKSLKVERLLYIQVKKIIKPFGERFRLKFIIRFDVFAEWFRI